MKQIERDKMKKVILTDCDGVLMDWERCFSEWMIDNGYIVNPEFEHSYDMAAKYSISESEKHRLIKFFNESSRVGYLPPLRDSIKYVKKLHEEHGYVFHMITSLSLNPFSQKLRIENTKRLFGETAFESFVFLDIGADKDEALSKYKDSGLLWVEDKSENAVSGINQGLDSVLISHTFNEDPFWNGGVPRYDTWKDLYEAIA